jgi:hypothetical protein
VDTQVYRAAAQSVNSRTEIILVTGLRIRVEGDAKDVERAILAAARGSIMELVWMAESETGEQIGVNPEYVVMLRAAGSETPGQG